MPFQKCFGIKILLFYLCMPASYERQIVEIIILMNWIVSALFHNYNFHTKQQWSMEETTIYASICTDGFKVVLHWIQGAG